MNPLNGPSSASSALSRGLHKQPPTSPFPIVVRITVRLLLSAITNLQNSDAVSVGVLATLLEILSELPPLSLQNEPSDVIDAFKSWLTQAVSRNGDSKKIGLTNAIECLFGLGIAKGSLTDILSTMALCVQEAPSLSNAAMGSSDQNISNSSLPFLNVAPFLKKLADWKVELVLSPICQPSLSGSWTARPHQIQQNTASSPSLFGDSLATDGTYLYIHNSNGLCKVGTGLEGTIQGRTYLSQTDFFPSERGWLCCVANRLYFRSPAIAPATLLVLDVDSLELVGEVWQAGNGSIPSHNHSRLPFGPEQAPSSHLYNQQDDASYDASTDWRSPLFTDGRYLYILSVIGFDYRFPKFAVDLYDPLSQMAHVNRVILQHQQNEMPVLFSPVFNPSAFSTTSFYTNGQYLYAVLHPSVSGSTSRRALSYDVPCLMLRKFRLENGTFESDLVTDLVSSFPMSSSGHVERAESSLGVVYDPLRNSIWCSRFPYVARFTNAGIAPRFDSSTPLSSSSPLISSLKLETEQEGPIEPLFLVASVMSHLSRLADSSMPNATTDMNTLPASMRVNPTSSRLSLSSSTILGSLSHIPPTSLRHSFVLEPFCVEVSQDTFWLLFTIIKQCQDKLHNLLVDNFTGLIERVKGSSDDSHQEPVSEIVPMIHRLLDIIDSGLSILAVNLQRLIAHSLNPIDMGLQNSEEDAELTDVELVKNFSSSNSLLSNLRRLLRYFVVVDDVYGFPLDNLASHMDFQDALFDSQVESIQLKACKVLTVGLEVFYPSYSGQSMLLLNLLNRMESSTERGPRRLLDSLLSVLAVHKSPSYLLLPPISDEISFYPIAHETEVSPVFAPLLAALIREAQSSLYKQQSSSPSPILILIQSIQKDLITRAEEAALRSSNSNALRALIEFVQVVLNQSVQSFARIIQSMETSHNTADSNGDNQINWWSMELMQEVTTSVVGLLLPNLLQSLFFFTSNLLVGRSILPPIGKLLEVVDILHSRAPAPDSADESGSWNWTVPEATKSSSSNVVETPHPYEPGKTFKQAIHIPEATFLSLIFDERCSTLDMSDCLELYEDEALHRKIHTQPSSFSGGRSKWPRRRIIVPGNRVVFVFKSQGAMNPPKLASAKFASSFESASTMPTTSSNTQASSRKLAMASWGFKCIIVGSTAMSQTSQALPWSVHLEKTLCCLGGQISAALIRGDPKTEEEKQFETTWLDHPLFDGGLVTRDVSLEIESPESLMSDFLISIVNQAPTSASFIRFISSMLPAVPAALEAKLTAVRRAERSILAAIILHSGLGPVAHYVTQVLNQSETAPEFTSPDHPIYVCFQQITIHMKRARDSLIQRRQQQQTMEEENTQISYRSVSDPVLEKALFLIRDVVPSILGSSRDEQVSMSVLLNRLGPRFETLATIGNAVCSFMLSHTPHQSLHKALNLRIRRAGYRCEGFEAMWKLLRSVRSSEMRQEVLRFLSSSMRSGELLSSSNIGANCVWPHSYLDNLRGCGPMLASRVRIGFEKLYMLLSEIMVHPESSPSLQLLAIEPWAMKFSASDLPFLHAANLFQILDQIHFTAKTSIESIKDQRSKQTISKKGSSVMQSRSALTPDQLLKLNAELDLKTQLSNSASSMFKLLALMCVSPGSIEVQPASESKPTSTETTPPPVHVPTPITEPTPFHDAFFNLIHVQLSACLEKARDETKHELAGTLKSASRLSELLDLLQFLHALSAADIVKKYLAQIHFVQLLMGLLLLRGDRSLRAAIFKLLRRVLVHPDTDPHMMVDLDGVQKPLVYALMEIIGTVSLWSSSCSPPVLQKVDPNLDPYTFARQVVTSTLLHSRTYERTVRKRALSRSVSGKLALTLPFCSFFSPALTFPVAWYSSETPKNPALEFSRDSRIAFVAGSAQSEDPDDLQSLAQQAVVIRGDNPIPDAVPFFYFEVRFEIIEESNRPFSTEASDPDTPNPSIVEPSSTVPSSGSLAVGLAAYDAPLYGLPGWFNTSLGYHSADGNKYRSSKEGRGERYGRKYSENDVIGCGWNRITGTVFFTKNGALLGTAFRNINPSSPLVPVVGIISSSPRSAIVNFGQMPFLFDTSVMVRRISQLVKQAHSRLGGEANLLAIEMTSLLRSIMVPANSPWRPAMSAILKEQTGIIPQLVNLAASKASSPPTKEANKIPLASLTVPKEPPARETSKELQRASSELPVVPTIETDSVSETEKNEDGEKTPVGTTSPLNVTPRPASSYDDLEEAIAAAVAEASNYTVMPFDTLALAHVLAALHVLGGDIEDLRVGGKVLFESGLNNNLGSIMEYRVTQPYRASVLFESQRRNHQTSPQATMLGAKPSIVPVFELTPFPEVVFPRDILQDVLPPLVQVVGRLFLQDHVANSTITPLRHSFTYLRLKAASMKVLHSAVLSGLSLCSLDISFASKLMEQIASSKENKTFQNASATVSNSPHPTGIAGNISAATSAPQSAMPSQNLTSLVPYQLAQSFNSSSPLSSLPARLNKIERISMNLSSRVFEINALHELPKIYQELIEEDDARVSRRSLDVQSQPMAASEHNFDKSSVDNDDSPNIDSDSGYLADSSSKRSRRSSQASKSSSSSSSAPNDAPIELASFGKPLRFAEIKLGVLMKLCLADKPRRPGDWQEDMCHLIGEVGIVVDMDPKLQQVLLRFAFKSHALFEDWWVPHRLLVLATTGLSHDEFFLLSMPQIIERSEPTAAPEPQSTTSSSITATLLAPFSSLLSSKEGPTPNPGSSKVKDTPKEGKDQLRDSAGSREPPSDASAISSATAPKESSHVASSTAPPVHVSVSSSRDTWLSIPKAYSEFSTPSTNQSGVASKDEGILYLALYWEQQRTAILQQLLFSALFLNDQKCISSMKTFGPIQLLHALRLVSAAAGEREVLHRLLGSQSPYSSFGETLAAASVGSASILSYPPRSLEHRIFEAKLFQLMKNEPPEDQQSEDPNSLITYSNSTAASMSPSSAVVPPLELPSKSSDNTAPTSPSNKLIAPPVTLAQIDPCSVLNLPPSNLPLVIPEEPLKGFLTKMGKVFRHKKYWFVLSGPLLSYYKNSQSNQPLVGSVDLRLLTGITGLEKRKKEHEFDLIWSDRSISLQATTNEEKERWINAITQHSQFFKLTSMPLTTKPVMTAFINECLLHIKDSVQSPLVVDSNSLVQSASKTATSSTSKSSSHAKEKEQTFVHPLSLSQLPVAHSKSESPAASSSLVPQSSTSVAEKEKSGTVTPNPATASHQNTQAVLPFNALLVASNVLGTSNPYVQAGNAVVLEQWLYPYAKRKMRKMVQLEWAENLLVEFDLSCSTKSGLNVLRLYRDAQCVDLIASFSGHGPACFPPTIVPKTDRFWMVFSCDATSADTDILSPNTGLVNHKSEYGVKFFVSSYMSHLPASLVGKPSFEFGLHLADWLLGLSTTLWVSQGAKEVFSYLAAHLETPMILDRKLRVLTQLTRLLQRWKNLFDSNPPISKVEHVVWKMFQLYASHKRLGHQDVSLTFQKKFELVVQVVKVGDALIASQPPFTKDSTTKEPKDTKERSDSSSLKREDSQAIPSIPSISAPLPGSYYFDAPSNEINYFVPAPTSVVASDPQLLPSPTISAPSGDAQSSNTATENDKPASSPRTVSFATNVQVKTAEDITSDDDTRARLTVSSEIVRDDSIVAADLSDAAVIEDGGPMSEPEDSSTVTSTLPGSKDVGSPAATPSSSSTKRVKKHRRSESSESEKKEKTKVERDKDREKAEKEREKAEKERERLEKLEKEKERLEREREREREKKKRKQAAKEAQVRAQSKSTKSFTASASSLTTITAGPIWSQHHDTVQQQGRSPWLAQLSVPPSASSASLASNKAWFDSASYTVNVLERLQQRRQSSQKTPPLTGYSYNQYNDFPVDFAQEAFLQARQQPVMMESPHPYPHGVRVTSRVHCPKATQLLVYFDARSRTEANCDYLMFSKELIGGDDLGFFTGNSFPPSHEPLVIPGDSFVWSFLSDANGLVATQLYWGFRFTVTPVFTEDVRLELAVKCEEEFRTGAASDSLCTPSHDIQLMRLVNSSVENLKISSFELNAEQTLANIIADPGTAASFPLLVTLPLSVLTRRLCYLKHLNFCLSKLVPLIDMSLRNESWSLAWLVHQSKHLLFYDVKLDLLNTSLIASQTALPKPVITLNRQQAALAEEAALDLSTSQQNQSNKIPKLRLKSSSRSINTSSATSTPRPSKPTVHSTNSKGSMSGEAKGANSGEFIFLQGFRNLHNVDPVRLRHSEKAWEVKFEGEGADDAGGPYRESLTQFCLDARRPALGLFIPTENQKGKVGLNQDRFVPDPNATSPKQLAKFEFLGKLMGIAIRTKQPLDLSFPSLVWKSLLGARLDRSDLEGIDKQLVMFLEAIENAGSEDGESHPSELPNLTQLSGINLHTLYARKFTKSKHNGSEAIYSDTGISSTEESVIQTHLSLLAPRSPLFSHPYLYCRRFDFKDATRASLDASMSGSSSGPETTHPAKLDSWDSGVTKEQFDQVYFETFRAARSRGYTGQPSHIDLVPNGSQVPVTWNNRLLFASKLEEFRLTEFAPQLSAMATGLASIVPTPVLSLLSWSELEFRVCGRPGLDIALLQRNTVYHDGLSASSKLSKDFWKALASFTAEEQMLFLRFVWGRSRLPSAQEFGSQRFHLQLLSKSRNGSPPPESAQPRPSAVSPTPSRTSAAVGTHRTESATRLMRLYYSYSSRVSDDDLQALLSTLHTLPSEILPLAPPFDQDSALVPTSPGPAPNRSPEAKPSSSSDSSHLPQSHTCFFQLSLPNYNNYTVLRSKLLYAITSCREIDTDFTPPNHPTPAAQPMQPQTNSIASPSHILGDSDESQTAPNSESF